MDACHQWQGTISGSLLKLARGKSKARNNSIARHGRALRKRRFVLFSADILRHLPLTVFVLE